VLVGEAWGVQEAKISAPFVGPSGVELFHQLAEAGIVTITPVDRDYLRKFWTTGEPSYMEAVWQLHPEVERLNVFNFHPPGNDLTTICGPRSEGIPGMPALLKGTNGYVNAAFEPHLDQLAEALNRLNPNIVVCLGNTPLWALAGKTGVTAFRGTTMLSTHTVADFKIIPTFHPAAVLRQYESRPIAIIDLAKAGREAESPYLLHTIREIWIEPTLEDIQVFHEQHIRGCDLLSVDTETAGDQVTCIGFAPSPRLALVVPFLDPRAKGRSYWRTPADESHAWRLVRGIITDPTIPKLFQNGMYDMAFLWRSVRMPTLGAREDTMLLHHALQPECQKALGFLGSLYADAEAWKARHRSRTNKKDE